MPAITKTIDTTATEQTTAYNQSYILLVSVVSALGGLLFGFDTAIISGTISFIEPYFNLNEYTLGWAVSSILIGCAAGAMAAGKLSDMLGRKKVLLICALLFALTGIGTGLSHSLLVFVLFRIAGGLAVGAAAMVAPMYIAETVPASVRGRLVSLYQLAIVSGILLAYLSNYLLNDVQNNWRWMFASQALPAVLFFICLFLVPETPRWLVKKKRKEEAEKILAKVGGDAYSKAEVQAIEQSFHNEQEERLEELFYPQFRKVVGIGIVIAIFQQVTGINAILYYAPEIFKKTGVDTQNVLLQTIGIGLVMFLFTLVAIRLVDKAGRKLLLFWGCLLMAVSLVVVAICFQYSYFDNYIVLVFLMLYIAGFSASLGAVTWVILSEIFPNRIRGAALSVSTLILWIADFAASFTFPLLNKKLGVAATLLIFAALCVVYLFYIKWKVPETKGKTLEQLGKELAGE
jgi:MFS transporter, SP family, arabinose:H+ symporter